MTRSKIRYTIPDTEGETITPSRLKQLGKDRQIEIMRQWFFENYEDPANRTPYESAEGGYIYIYGGPFEAQEELGEEFGGLVKDEFIDELAGELNDICWEWTHTERPGDYGDDDDYYEIDAALDESVPLDAVYIKLDKIKRLLNECGRMDADLRQFHLMMTFSFCITVLESYLSDTFIKKVFSDQKHKEKYLQANPDLRSRKITLCEIYKEHSSLDKTIKDAISKTSFHDLGKIAGIYKGVLDIDFGDVGALISHVNKRHDFVHRAGKDNEGNDVVVTKNEVDALIAEIGDFCRLIDAKQTFTQVRL